jgi:glycosyltransferase involved in cell wall biosynthesis
VTVNHATGSNPAHVKIDIISQLYLPEPAGIFAGDLAERWAQRGHEVTVWTATPWSGASSAEVIQVSPRTGYDRSSLVARVSSQFRFFGPVAWGFARRKWASRLPDVVVAVGSPALAAMVPTVTGIQRKARVVQWVYDLYPEALLTLRPHDPVIRALRTPIETTFNVAWRRADALVAISPRMAERVKHRTAGANVHMIPLWARDEVRPRSDRALPLRRARGIPDDAFVAMYHGNLGLAYDFDPLLQGARLLAGERKFIVALVGAGAQLDDLRARLRAEGLSNVRLFPPVATRDLPDSLAMGDCHVIGLREGWSGVAFPSKFITAIAAGRPVVVMGPRACELSEMIDNAKCGTVVPPKGESFVEALRFLEAHPECAAEQGKLGRSLYESRFDRKIALRRWDTVIGA